MKPLGDLDVDQLFHEDMLGDDLEAWLDESVMMKRAFRQCAVLAGLIKQRFPGPAQTAAGRSPSPSPIRSRPWSGSRTADDSR